MEGEHKERMADAQKAAIAKLDLLARKTLCLDDPESTLERDSDLLQADL